MPNIKEIALKLQATDRFRLNVSELSAIEFAEALIAELAKGNEPRAFLHEWSEYHPFGDTVVGEPFATITNDEKPFDSSDTVSPLFTFPLTAEQIANETAEAIAEYMQQSGIGGEFLAESIRSGEWRKFMKGE